MRQEAGDGYWPAGCRPGRAEALLLLETIQACLGCRSRQDFLGLFPKIQAMFPVDHALALIGRLDGPTALAVDGINVSFPENWVRSYVGPGSFARDAMVRQAFATYEPRFWSDATVRLPEPNALSLCRDFGLRRGGVTSCRPLLSGRDSSMFCFCGPSVGARDKRTALILAHLLPHLHLALLGALRQSSPAEAGSLPTKRETEVLHWLARGKSSWDIAMILRVAERTVNFHVANLMRKLGTANRVQTVAVALRRGLIDVD